MLILSRRIGESIMIGDNIQITVTDINRGRVRIHFFAPREVEIYRQEIYEARRKRLLELSTEGLSPSTSEDRMG